MVNLRKFVMAKRNSIAILVLLVFVLLIGGCVERKLTVLTEPVGAIVALNDEEIGRSPVTVSFEWYGDYNVRISKEGYETLKTHRKLKGPWYDKFPFDFFAQILNPRRIENSYEWTFQLEEKQYPDREKLLEAAKQIRDQL